MSSSCLLGTCLLVPANSWRTPHRAPLRCAGGGDTRSIDRGAQKPENGEPGLLSRPRGRAPPKAQSTEVPLLQPLL